jgi:hypothetical protein
LEVTIIAARKAAAQPESASSAPGLREELPAQLLDRAATGRPGSRFVPPPPILSPGRLEQMLTRQGGIGLRRRRSSPKMLQTQLPLEIVSKGRFDKSEPTVHKGEDLDVPTYIRRGIALN